MEQHNQYLNEERYQKNKKRVARLAAIIVIIGFAIGGGLIVLGLINSGVINLDGVSLEEKIAAEKEKVLASEAELEAKIEPIQDEITQLDREPFTGFDDEYYAREDRIVELRESIKPELAALSAIDKALDETFDYCGFNEAENNAYTKDYCALKNKSDSPATIPFFIFGVFIIIFSCMMAFPIYIASKRREILAFSTQQVMPVAKEGAETMAPTMGKVAKEIAKGVKDGWK